MVSFQGLVRRNIVNMNIQNERLGAISDNFANFNTNAYKGVDFKQFVTEDGYVDGVGTSDHSLGALMKTEQKLDIGLATPGYIPVTSESGDVVYTRDGSLRVNKDGYLITFDNFLVGDGIKIPHNYYDITIKPDGAVQVIKEAGNKHETVGYIPVVNFPDPHGLKQLDGNKYLATRKSGDPYLSQNHEGIRQGMLERSNVDMYKSSYDAMRIMASQTASLRFVQAVNKIYDEAINLQQ